MEHSQLKATANALFGFTPEWTPSTCEKLCKRLEELGTIPAVYLRTVMANLKVPGNVIRYANVILSRKWEQFIPDQLHLMEEQARVRRDSDMVEFRSALQVCRGDYRDALEDVNFDISCLGRYRIAKLYGLEEVAEKFAHAAMGDALANPFLAELYDNLQEDD